MSRTDEWRATAQEICAGAWFCASIAWLIVWGVGGGSINMAVGITMAACFVTLVTVCLW